MKTARAADRIPLRTRMRYWFDLLLSKGILGLLAVAVVVGALLMVAISFLSWLLGGLFEGSWNPLELWLTFLSGFGDLFRADLGEGAWHVQLVGFIFAMAALFFGGIIFGALVRAVRDKYAGLEDRGGQLIASDHTVLLGWSPLGIRIVSELAIANENRTKPEIAILAQERPGLVSPGRGVKPKLERELASLPMRTTRLNIRPGDLTTPEDFDIVRLDRARSVIVLADWQSPDHDPQIVATLMALARYREARPNFRASVVACVKDPQNVLPAKVAAKYPATVFDVKRLLARLTLQSSRQKGLFPAVSQLLRFEGDELYIVPCGGLAGRCFEELAEHFPTSTPIGLVRAASPILNPQGQTRVEDPDEIIVITEDDDTAVTQDVPCAFDAEAIVRRQSWAPTREGESWLFVGWSPEVSDVLTELSSYLGEAVNSVTIAGNAKDLPNLEVISGGLTNLRIDLAPRADGVPLREFLEGLGVHERSYVVLTSKQGLKNADDETLLTLLHVRDLVARMPESDAKPMVVSELLDSRYRRICEEDQAQDVVVSTDIVSRLLAQTAEEPRLLPIFEDMLDGAGSEIYLKPAELYVRTGRPASFMAMAKAAAERGEIAIGYRLLSQSGDAGSHFGVHLNPAKSDTVVLEIGDSLVVIAEDEWIPGEADPSPAHEPEVQPA